MHTPPAARRAWVASATLLACAGWALLAAPARAAAKEPVLLTVTGPLTRPNSGDTAHFDLARLKTLPQTSFSTKTPWYPTPRKFSGVLVRDLLEAVGARATMVQAIALNDYRVEMPLDDLVAHGALIAWLLDDQPMPVREKGPLVIIFPFSDRPALRTATHYSRAVWQLSRLELR